MTDYCEIELNILSVFGFTKTQLSSFEEYIYKLLRFKCIRGLCKRKIHFFKMK